MKMLDSTRSVVAWWPRAVLPSAVCWLCGELTTYGWRFGDAVSLPLLWCGWPCAE
jgi:hypothetical protein